MSLATELVPPMPAMSMQSIERIASEVLSFLDVATDRPYQLNWQYLIDVALPKVRLFVSPVNSAELQGDEAAADPSGPGPDVEILVREDVYETLFQRGARGNRARATLPHEVSHAILHVPRIRQSWHAINYNPALLRRVARVSIPPYCDPEWQAWAMAGCLVAPRVVLTRHAHLGLATLASQMGVSQAFLANHAKRLKVPVGGVHAAR